MKTRTTSHATTSHATTPCTTGPARLGLFSIAAAAVAWGTGGAVAAVLFRSSGLGPVSVSCWRFAIAAVLLTVLPAARPTPAPWRSTVLTGAGLALYQTAYFGAVANAGVAVGTLVTLGAGPVLIAVGARYTLGERLTRSGAAAIVIALGGLLLLTVRPGTAGAHPLLGAGFALASAAGYSVMTLLARAGHGGGASLGVFGSGLACLLPFALGGPLLPARQPAGAAAALLFLGVVPTLLAYRWFFAGLATVPAATASVVVLLEPVTATAVAIALLGERLTAAAAFGALLLLGAVIVLVRKGG